MKFDQKIQSIILESSSIIKEATDLTKEIDKTISLIIKTLKKGNKIILFGNGGSAADAQHIAAEFLGRFKLERSSYPALALTTDSSTLTSIGNDYSFDFIFSRQCEKLVSKGDIVIGISTSGSSKNVKLGLEVAKKNGAITIGMLGNKGGQIRKIVDIPIIIKSSSTPRIQEVHRTIFHIICELVEEELES
jgi:D-sedoheptulose 7-phosphate isomerase